MRPNQSNLIPIKRAPLPKSKSLHLAHVNARSIPNKMLQFKEYILDKDVDICAITETWLKQDPNDDTIKEVPPTGYKIVTTPRSDGRMGGGIALVFKEHLSISPLAAQEDLTSMEHNAFNLCLQHTTITIHVIYRYPNTSTLNFCNELVQIAESTINSGGKKTIFTGDFNIHMDQVDTPDTITFNDVLDSLNLKKICRIPDAYTTTYSGPDDR